MSMACNFCWYEIMTADVEAAKAFYGPVIGWTAEPMGGPNAGYTILSAGGRGVAGILEAPEHMRSTDNPPFWFGYIAVGNADETAERIAAAGGIIHRPPSDIPTVGRFAVIGDPQGAVFNIMQPFPTEVPPAAPRATPGHPAWHELYASDAEAAFRFYSAQFGWGAAEAFDMGPMGTYQLFNAGGEPIGGMMNRPPAMPQPVWLYYFWVDGIDAAAERVTANGGTISHGPDQVPGGDWVVQAKDPAGAMFGLVSTRR
jgi:predicted enzyme related to lactoylglutathione lyase